MSNIPFFWWKAGLKHVFYAIDYTAKYYKDCTNVSCTKIYLRIYNKDGVHMVQPFCVVYNDLGDEYEVYTLFQTQPNKTDI